MSNERKSDANSQSRRELLRTSGVALATVSIGAPMTVAAQDEPSPSNDDVSTESHFGYGQDVYVYTGDCNCGASVFEEPDGHSEYLGKADECAEGRTTSSAQTSPNGYEMIEVDWNNGVYPDGWVYTQDLNHYNETVSRC
jgi:hypothetical protein